MALRHGKCTNFGNCSIADNGKILTLADQADFLCEECGKQLIEIRKSSSSSKLLIILFFLLLFGAAAFAVIRYVVLPTFFPDKASQSAVQPAVNPPPVAKLPQPTQKPLEPKEENILRLHGSNTIGAKLAPSLAEEFLKQQGAIQVRQETSHETTKIRGIFGQSQPEKVIEIQAIGTDTAFRDMAEKKCDIGLASRKIYDNEAQKLGQSGLGDMTSPACEHVLGLDGIAIIVHRSNPVKMLSMEQIAGIFSGEISDWSAVGGNPGPIRIYSRDDRSGTYETFRSLVLRSKPLSSSAQLFEDSSALSDKVASYPNAIGFVGLPYIASAKALEVYEPGATPLLPTSFTVATEDYPLSRRLFLYTPEVSQNPFVRKFVEFALSKTGQEIVRKNGFTDQTITAQKKEKTPDTARSAPPKDAYQRVIQNVVQLSTTFRFKAGSDILDNRSVRDLDRVADTLSQPEYRGKRFILIGFADSTGAENVNVLLSRSRALAVSEELKKRGLIAAQVEGMGSKRPVASNATQEGREKNRRVEIWIEEQ